MVKDPEVWGNFLFASFTWIVTRFPYLSTLWEIVWKDSPGEGSKVKQVVHEGLPRFFLSLSPIGASGRLLSFPLL